MIEERRIFRRFDWKQLPKSYSLAFATSRLAALEHPLQTLYRIRRQAYVQGIAQHDVTA